jgi:hypothetical protein
MKKMVDLPLLAQKLWTTLSVMAEIHDVGGQPKKICFRHGPENYKFTQIVPCTNLILCLSWEK